MTRLLPPLYWMAMVAILVWNIQLSGRTAQNRRAPRLIALLSGLAGLLLAPAAIAAGAAPSLYSGRTVQAIVWLWPAVNLMVATQALLALIRRHVTPAVGIPFLLYDLVVLGVAASRHMVMDGGPASPWVVALAAANAGALGLFLGQAALFSPVALQLPLLAPITPARWRVTSGLRAGLALFAAAWTALVGLVEYPRAVRAVAAFARYDNERLQERPAGDFVVGVQLFPVMRRPPSPLQLANDVALYDSLHVDAVALTIAPEGTGQGALDSLARTLEEVRRDSALLVVSLGYPAGARKEYAADPARYTARRMLELRRILRTIRPDVMLPAVDPYGEGAAVLGVLPLSEWEGYLVEAARVVEEVRPRTRVGVSASSFSQQDSALYAWAAAPESPIEVVGFTLFPSFDGGLSLEARLGAAGRWMAAADPTRAPKPHWVFHTGSYPLAFGEQAQREAIWGVLAWATAHSQLRGVIVGDAADYGRVTGLRVTGGRLRPAAASVSHAVRLLRETAQ